MLQSPMFLTGIDELDRYIFSFLPPKKNVENTQVCKAWQTIAGEEAKQGFLRQYNNFVERSINHINLTALTACKLEDFCPQYMHIANNVNSLTIKEVFDQLHAMIKKNDHAYLAGCFVITPDSENIPEEFRNEITGKAFAELLLPLSDLNRDTDFPANNMPWREPGKNPDRISYLPIEFLGLTIGEDRKVVGEKDSGTFCFPLKGRLIQLTLIPWDPRFSIGARATHLKQCREIATTLTPYEGEIPLSERIRKRVPRQVYVSRLHAKSVSSPE